MRRFGSSPASRCAGRSPSSLRALMNHCTSRGTQRFSSSSMPFNSRRMRRSWSSESSTVKVCGRRASRQCSRSSRWARPWKVPTQRLAAGMPSRCSMRARISPAALLVKVTASTPHGDTPSTWTSQAMRCTSTRVLPLPAPASTSTGASAGAVTASRWASFRGSRIGVMSMAAHCTRARPLAAAHPRRRCPINRKSAPIPSRQRGTKRLKPTFTVERSAC